MMSLAASEAGQPLAASISAQWTAFLDMGVAQDLSAAMGQQQDACGRALSLKTSLLASMKDSLAVKDAHYIETLGTHARVRSVATPGDTPCLIIAAALMALYNHFLISDRVCKCLMLVEVPLQQQCLNE